jgi:hypothetical protein
VGAERVVARLELRKLRALHAAHAREGADAAQRQVREELWEVHRDEVREERGHAARLDAGDDERDGD